MLRSKNFHKKIKVGDKEIPVKGLEPVMFLVLNMNLDNEEKILDALLKEITQLGNIIPMSRENNFCDALMKEYREFVDKRISIRKNKRGL
jgi:hypothetical protein